MKSTPRVTPYSESLRFLCDLDFLEGLEVLSLSVDSLAFLEGGGGEEGVLRFLEVEVEDEGSAGVGSSRSWSSAAVVVRCVARTISSVSGCN